jgi:anti-sigma factor RsiW
MKERRNRGFEELSAYHDGELRGLARWRFERRLRRDPRLRQELEWLRRVGDAARGQAEGAASGGVDLWDRVAMRLPAADAGRSEARRAARGLRPAWLVGAPLGAAAAAALAAVAVVSWLGEAPRPADGVVRWMYAGKRNVVVLESPGAPGTTIIWVLDGGPKQAEQTAQTPRRRPGGMA